HSANRRSRSRGSLPRARASRSATLRLSGVLMGLALTPCRAVPCSVTPGREVGPPICGPFLECGGSTPLWMFGCLDEGRDPAAARDPQIQSGVEPPHFKNRRRRFFSPHTIAVPVRFVYKLDGSFRKVS